MTSQIKILWVALIAVAIIALGGYSYPHLAQLAGGVTSYDEVDASAFKSGSSGTRFGNLIFGFQSCVLIDGASITASSTKSVDCAVTGVVAGDTVFVLPASTTRSGSQFGWAVTGASASSTSGFVTTAFSNFTGANAVPPSTATTTQVLVIHPLTSVPGL